MKAYKVTVFLENIYSESSDDESFKDAVKEAMQLAVDLDDSGDEELDFVVEEQEEDEDSF
jgi:20S proteasome alpha/beta subunit